MHPRTAHHRHCTNVASECKRKMAAARSDDRRRVGGGVPRRRPGRPARAVAAARRATPARSVVGALGRPAAPRPPGGARAARDVRRRRPATRRPGPAPTASGGGASPAPPPRAFGAHAATGRRQHSPKNRRRSRFFLAIAKTGPYSESVFGCGDIFRRVNRDSDSACRRRGAVDDRRDERRAAGLNALGRHLLLELFDCDTDAINNVEAVKSALIEAAKRAQATIVDVVFHEFNPFGISGVVVIAESHLSIHTWPEYRYAAVDVFSCGESLQPEIAVNYLVEQFAAERASVVEMQRGVFVNSAVPIVNKAAVAVS
jgi:S-adenosylmethionine decarboxylase